MDKPKRFVSSRELAVYDLLSSGNRFLDVGCGDGNLVRLAKSKFKETWGVDLLKARLVRGKQGTSSSMQLIQCDAEYGLPFRDACFDTATCVDVLRFIVNPSKVINEIERVLKIGGEIIVQVPNFLWLPSRIRLLFGKIPMAGYYSTIYHIFTKSLLCRLLKSQGFEVDCVLCGGKFKRIRRLSLSLLSSDIVAKCHKSNRKTHDMEMEILYGRI